MIRKKLRNIIAIALAAIGIFTAGIMYSKCDEKEKESQYKNLSYEIADTKVDTKSITIDNVKEIGELNFMQASINHSIEISRGWKCFSKCKTINFQCIGKYSLDFSKISSNNVHIQGQDVKIYCSKPTVDVMILHDNVTYQDDNGMFAGDLKLEPEEMNKIESQTIKDVKTKITSKAYMDDAKLSAERSIENILMKFGTKVTVTIQWIE